MALLQKKLGLIIIFVLFYAIKGELDNVKQESVCGSTQCPVKDEIDHWVECTLIGFNASNPMCVDVWSSYQDCKCTDSNYRISSSGRTYWCESGGSWSKDLEKLKCFAPCYTDADDEAIATNEKGDETNLTLDSDFVTYTCPPGYHPTGTKTVPCHNGTWGHHEIFLCHGNCSIPENYVTVAPPNKEIILYDHDVTMKCRDGYVPTEEITATCENESFGDIPECQSVFPCSHPYPDSELVSVTPNRTSYNNGSTITYSCPQGYDLGGDKGAVCVDGNWTSVEEPFCTASPCGKPSPEDDSVEIKPNKTEYQHNETVEFSCLNGYDLTGASNAICQFGVWDTNLNQTCKPSQCDNPSLEDTRVIFKPDSSEYQHNDTVEFSCPSGYTLTGDSGATCQFGVWVINVAPSCEPSACDNPRPNDTRVIITPDSSEHQHNDTVVFSCPSGYDLMGDPDATCQFGVWEIDVAPTCEPSSCSSPGTNDTRVIITPDSSEYQHNDTVEFSCPLGYTLMGDSGATCQFGVWDIDVDPTCGPSACDNPSLNDTRVIITPDSLEYQHNDPVVFSCPSGYDLIGDSDATCQFGFWEIDVAPTCEPSSCSNPDPEDTRVIITPVSSEYQHNDTVEFSCPSGYTLMGDSDATCLFGVWEIDVDPTCEPSACDKPSPNDTRVIITPDKSEYQHNDTAAFSCPSGYDLIGDSGATCQFGVWEIDMAPTCEPSPCENPSVDDNRVEITPNNTEYQHNEKVKFSCPAGYDLNGNSSAVCRFGDWGVLVDPTCDPSPCKIPNPADKMVEISPNAPEYQHNETVTFSCPNGYDLLGDSIGLCQFGRWEISLEPFCHLENITCERPIVEDSLVSLNPDLPKYPNGTIVQFECPEGYGLLGNSSATCLSADWNPFKEPECYALPCDKPSPEDDSVEITPDKTEYQHNETVEFSCLDGYDLTGASDATCQFGVWDAKLNQTCQPSPCDNPSPYDTRVIITPDSSEYQHYDTVEFSCPSGYDLLGNSSATCQFGAWEIDVAPSCEPSPCGNPSPNDTRVIITPDTSEYQHNDTVEFSCLSGYDLLGNSSATCQFGAWEIDVPPTCEPSSCGNPSLNDTSVIITPDNTEYQHNDTVGFSCPSGYDLMGDSVATCKFGVWEIDVAPTCEPSPCGNPGPNDTRVIIIPDSSKYQHNDTVEFSCPSGYDLRGNSSGTCQFGVWEIGVAPTCEPSPCVYPSPNDTKVIITPDNTEYHHNDTVEFSCPSGYDLMGDSDATCQFGVWEIGVSPTCEPFPCSNPSLNDTRVIVTPEGLKYQHNDTVTFSCPSKYELIGDSDATCQFGVWEIDVDPTCKPEKCLNPYPKDENVIIEPYQYEYEYDSTVHYSCPEGYTRSGSSNATCVFGEWVQSHDPPTCNAKRCERPEVEGVNFEPDQETYNHGELITFSCPEEETLVGNTSSTCTLGVFSPSSFPSCVDTISEFCTSSSLKNKDEIVYAPLYEVYAKDEQINLSCRNSSLALIPFIREMSCQGNNNWSPNFPSCGECRNSEMCQTSTKRVCDKETSLCLCQPGYESFEGGCIETMAVVTQVSLKGDFDKTLSDKSSKKFADHEKNVCSAFKYALTNRNSNVKDGYVSCIVESFYNGSIIADVVTKYNNEENVTPEQVTDIIATEAEQHDNTIPGLGLNFTDISAINSSVKVIEVNACEEKTDVCDPGRADCHYSGGSSYRCTCKAGFIDTTPNVPGVSCVAEVRDPLLGLTVGLGAGVALCFFVLLATSVAIFTRFTKHDDKKKTLTYSSKEGYSINGTSAPNLQHDDESKHNSFDTRFVNHGYISDEPTDSALHPVSETERMAAIANTIQNMGNMEPMPRIKPIPENNYNEYTTSL